jgi:hypothetical protein
MSEVAIRASPWDGMPKCIHTENLELPGRRLKINQVQQQCGAERTLCHHVLEAMLKQDSSASNRTECMAVKG